MYTLMIVYDDQVIANGVILWRSAILKFNASIYLFPKYIEISLQLVLRPKVLMGMELTRNTHASYI